MYMEAENVSFIFFSGVVAIFGAVFDCSLCYMVVFSECLDLG